MTISHCKDMKSQLGKVGWGGGGRGATELSLSVQVCSDGFESFPHMI